MEPERDPAHGIGTAIAASARRGWPEAEASRITAAWTVIDMVASAIVGVAPAIARLVA